MALRNSSRLILAMTVATATYVGNSTYSRSRSKKREVNLPVLADEVPSRDTMLSALRGSSAANPYDVLVIGGGATGTGVALDAVTRGLKVALVEREDFGSGTSSRSTKLVHGGVRYLERAVSKLDSGELKLVFHALRERATVLQNAPHLTNPLPIMTPCYSFIEAPYYWAGLKLYDLVAGPKLLFMSRFLWAREALDQFPQLAKTSPDGRSLKGAVVYFDGQMDDARLNVALACTAALVGATVANHTEVKTLHKDVVTQKIVGARVQDKLSGKEFDVHAKVVVNATGPFCDSVRKMADKEAKEMVRASSGVHIILPDYYSPKSMGLIVPKTKDGRVLFMLPWMGKTLAGTTDADTKLTMRPEPTEEDIKLILDGITDFLAVKVRREDVMSAWSGIRPLVTDPSASDTASASRNHVVVVDDDGLVSIAGGKWTTYRSMAEDAVDAAVKAAGLSPHNQSVTDRLRLVGAEGYDPGLVTVLTQQYRRMKISHGGKIIPGAFDSEVAHHLVRAYGGRAESVAFIAQVENLGKRLAHGYPVLEAEVAYCSRNEFCESAIDFIARRSRLAFLDTAAALQALPRVVDILASEKKWDWRRKRAELDEAKAFLKTFGSSKNAFFIDGKHIKPEMKP